MKKVLLILFLFTSFVNAQIDFESGRMRLVQREEGLENIPLNNLIGYFEFEDNANNLVGDKDIFTTENPTYSNGWTNKAFDGSTTSFKATAPDNDLLSFANAGNDEPFSVSFWINTSDYG